MSLVSPRGMLLVAIVALAAAAAALLLAFNGEGRQPSPPLGKAPGGSPTFTVDTDHETFSTIGDIRGASPVIVVGTVKSSTVVPGVSPGNDGAGDPLPALPQTDYVVEVTTIFKGSLGVGEAITVSLTGGATPQGDFVLDGGPHLDNGDSALFFLEGPQEGKYYPLAGGAAVADQQLSGDFLLPGEVTGQAAIPVSQDELTKAERVADDRGRALVPPDTIAPRISLAGSRHRQKLARTFVVSFSCPEEACAARASARLHLPKTARFQARTYALGPLRQRLEARSRGSFVFHLKAKLRGRARSALRTHRRVSVDVSITIADVAQNTTTVAYRVFLTR